MNSGLAPTAPALLDGSCVATCRRSGLQVGYETFTVRASGSGLLIESRHVCFGRPAPVLQARFFVDADWTPRRLEAEAGDAGSATVEFSERAATLIASREGEEERLRLPVLRRDALVLLSGVFHSPLHVVRRFPLDGCGPRRFQIIPEGLCEVRHAGRLDVGEGEGSLLEMRIWIGGVEDILRLLVDDAGDLSRFTARNRDLLVSFENGRPSC